MEQLWKFWIWPCEFSSIFFVSFLCHQCSPHNLANERKQQTNPSHQQCWKMPSTMQKKKLAQGRLARMSQNRHCNQGLLGHPVLWTPGEAITAITTWTIDPSLEREAIWLRTKHNVPLGPRVFKMALRTVRSGIQRGYVGEKGSDFESHSFVRLT